MKTNLLPSKLFVPLFLLALVSWALPARAQSVWSSVAGVNTDTNWSDAANWSPVGVPGAATNVFFTDTAGVSGTGIINSVVDENLTIQALIFRQTNTVFHNLLISPGITLTISNSAAATNLWAGTEAAATSPTTLMLTNTISGAGGTLAITSTNVASVISVRQTTTAAAGSHLQVLDMSGLDTFNVSIGNLFVGVFGGTAVTRPQGQLFLAKTNNITVLAVGTKTAPAMDIGDTGASPDSNNLLALGISNSIAADTIEIGNQRSSATLKFNPSFVVSNTPSFLLRGHSGTRVTTFNVGDNSSATANIGSVTVGTVDFSGGIVDAMVGSMILGDGQPITGTGAGTATGTFTMTGGKFDVNTLELGFQNNTGVTAVNTGTANISGGTLSVNTSLRLAFFGGSGGLTKGTLNITNGTVQANTIVAGGGTSAINMVGGKLIVTNTIGTVAVPLSTLVVVSGATLQFSVGSGTVPAQVSSLITDGSGVINVSSLPAIAAYPAVLPLIAYQGGSGAGFSFTAGSLPGTFTGYITNDNLSTISVVITNGPNLASVVWAGNVNNIWDTNTLNWKSGASPAKYRDADVVTFDDTASTANVNVSAIFAPEATIFNNNSDNYSFTGSGSITGITGLILNGTDSVTLAETGGDNFSGGILVNKGSIILDDASGTISGGLTIAAGATAQIGNGDTNGTLPSGSLDNEGTLIFDHSDNIVVGVGIPGAGSLVQNGSGTLTLAAANTFSGSTTVNAGTLVLSNSAALASTSQINVTGGTLDVSGVAGKVQLNNLSLTGAGLTVSASATQTNLFVNSLTLGGANNTINIALLPSVASYPATVTVLQTAGGIPGFNFRLGTLPAGSAGSVALSDDSTAVLLTLTSGPISLRPSVTWVGLDFLNNVSTNWSDRLNWQLPGEPVAGDNVIFNNNAISINGSAVSTPGGGIASLISAYLDNIVDANFSIASLTYTNAGGLFHNTFINSGSKLTVTNHLIVGGFDTGSTLTQVGVSISGTNATLDVENTNGTVQVWLGSGSAILPAAMLDLSALDTFTANISQLGVGACTTNNAVNRPGGILYLARTNTINCTIPTTAAETGSTTGNLGLIVGDCNQNNGSTSTLFLGQVNSISADAVAIARQKTTASMSFNPALVNIAPYPTVTFKGFTTGIVSNFDVGDGVGNTGTTAGTGTVDLTGGIVTATVDMLNVGRASAGTNGSGTTTGVMGFDAGTITANTVNIGIQPVTGSKAGVGTMNVNSNSTIGEAATLVVNGDLNIGVSAGGASAASTGGTLNINGGTVQTANIIVGTNTSPSIINLTSGTLAITGTAGSPDAPITTLNLSGNLQLNVNGGANVTNIVATSVNAGGAISLQINSLFNVTAGVVYPLISYPVGSSDPFSSLSLTLPSGYVGVLVDNSATGIVGLQLSTVPVVHAARLTSISLSGTTLNITGTGGSANGQFVLLGSTNITTPLNQWTPILTNSFDGSGNLNLSTNIVNPAVPVEFYILLQ